MCILDWFRGNPLIITPIQATITKQIRDSHITPSVSLDPIDIKAMRIGYCVIQRLPELLPKIEAEIEVAKQECVASWNKKC